MDTLFLIGIAVLLGIFGGRIFRKLKMPQVVGYIIIGALLGESAFGLLKQSSIEAFNPIINVTLGLIGFRIGIELKGEVFKKYGRSIYAIIFSEGLLTFFVVTLLVTLVTKKLYLGLLLGAIASATAPAVTTDVLREYKTKGPLTTTLLAVIGLDDSLSLIIYGFASVFAKSMIAKTGFTLLHGIGVPLFELAEAGLIGASIGYGLSRLLRYIKDKECTFSLTIAAIILTVGLSIFIKVDFILSAMVLGVAVSNLSPPENRKIFDNIEKFFSPPLYVLFFVLVGARLQVKLFLNLSIVSLTIVYLIARTSGKMAGAYLGAFLSNAQKTVRKYLGLGLFSQAGIGIGLAMAIYYNLSLLGPAGKETGLLVINIITATIFVVEIIGPACLKFAVTKADEVWRNVTEEDIIESCMVRDMMRRDFSAIRENATLDKIIETIKEKESYRFPVINNQGELAGLISLGGLRNTFMEEEQLNEIVLARDVAEPAGTVLYQNQPLKEAFEIFDKREIDYLPVVQDKGSKKVVGIVEYHPLVESVNRKLFERQKALENEPEKQSTS